MIDKGHGGVELYFEDGNAVVVDLVVGADGIRSVILFYRQSKRGFR